MSLYVQACIMNPLISASTLNTQLLGIIPLQTFVSVCVSVLSFMYWEVLVFDYAK